MRSKWLKYGGAALVAMLMVAVVAGCSSSTPASSGSTSTPAKATLKTAMVTDIGGLGDKSFNDLSYAGLQEAKAKLGVDIKVLESKAPTDYESNITNLANAGYSPIFAVGFLMTDTVSKLSTAYPDVTFGGIDESFSPPIKNVVGINFKEQEGAYLAGYLAAKLTTMPNVDSRINDKPILGFVGGMDIPPVQRYQAGFIAGAKAANPAVVVKSVYAGSFTDQQKGIEDGKALIDQGADIVFAAAGQTGLGTAKACQDNKAIFIGVDADQFLTIPGIGDTILTSAVKKVDVAVFDTVRKASEGTLQGGADVLYGLKEDGVGLAPYHDWDAKIPADVKAAVEKAKTDIAAGTITVPTTAPAQ
ncbi:MAG: BMP family ABC transporter substrate-binding protein [Coriobacteriia bacterium]|nr:BMP family ABC transporter substrate-binding protein [Coriobacteriia bacterium]